MKTLSIILFLLLSVFINAQESKLNFDFDYAQFAYDSTSNYIEFYYSFGQEGLLHNQTDSSIVVEGTLNLKVVNDSTNTPVIDKEWKISHEISDSIEVNKSLVGEVSFILKKGDYRCVVSGRDLNDTSISRTYKELIKVVPFENNSLALSNIQLGSNIIQNSPNKNSIFYKNSFEVIPIPASIYGENLPVVFYYLEIYNIQSVDPESSMNLNTLVYSSKNKLMFSKSKKLTQSVNSMVDVGTITVNKYPTDIYTLVIGLTDTAKNYGMSSSKRFFIYNPSIENTDTSFGTSSNVLASQFGVMSDEELDDLFKKAKYIATKNEIDKFESLTSLDGKREFFHNFWKSRDTNPSTPDNEFYKLFLSRVQMSNARFGSLSKDGWKSDRGRIYITYGEPSEIERFPNQIDTKPYEIWHYNDIEGGVVFVFADITGFSDYILLHSTLRGEMRDDNWMRRITSF